MVDAHCHLISPGAAGRIAVCAAAPSDWETVAALPSGTARFFGVHPWWAESEIDWSRLRELLLAFPSAGIGEIGLDRLKSREVSAAARTVFAHQLELAAELERPVTLHGAKCWGEVVGMCAPFAGRVSAFLFHGFSRSLGLMPRILELGGYVSVGPALLNDHAVNYRAFAAEIPLDRLLVESDRTADTPSDAPGADAVAAKLAEIRGLSVADLESTLSRNFDRFCRREQIGSEIAAAEGE